MREEEVTSERDQTVLNLIDGVKSGEDEAVEEEAGGRVDQFVASLLAGQHKPGTQCPTKATNEKHYRYVCVYNLI